VADERVETSLPAFRHHLKAGGRLLDFGCGNGSFLIAARKAGFTCEGVELEEKARERAAANSGCDVLPLEVLLQAGRKYDVIHLGDVLEHLSAPAATMRALEPLLSEEGMFFIEGPLEENRSLVFYAAKAVGLTKKLLGRPLHSDLPPFHLFRATARAQRDFFERRLGYRVREYSVFESGWPYYVAGDRLLRPGSAGRLVRMLIGRAGVGAARILGATPLMIGNRFVAIAAPDKA
jgi:SAM-dependent methyltransferase